MPPVAATEVAPFKVKALFVPLAVNETAPEPALIFCATVNPPLLLVTVILPLVVLMPFMAPTEPMVKSAAALLEKLNALALPVKLAAKVPMLLLLVRMTSPEAVIFNPAALKVVTPLCVMSPVTLAMIFLPTDALPNTRELALVMEASLVAPELVSVTAPVKALADVKVIAFAPALKLAVPGTVNAPDCVMAPPAMADKLPPAFKVSAGKAMAALLNSSVKLRKLVNKARLVGNAAPLFVLRKPTSRMFASVPPKVTAPVKLLACVCNEISLFAAVDAMVKAPAAAACVMAPVCVMAPPEVRASVPVPTLDVPMTRAPLLVKATLLAPELESETAPVKALAEVKVMAFAPALKLEVPGTVRAPVCVIAPLEVMESP